MKLVKFTKDVLVHSAFCGEVMGFADDVAAKLVKNGKAALIEEESAAPVADIVGPVAESVDDERAPKPDADAEGDDDDEPAPRGRGRPRKVRD